MPVLSLACHLPHNTPNIPSRYNNEQTTKQTKAINNSYIYISHVNVTQTGPDISPLMPMHQDPLLVWYVMPVLWYYNKRTATCNFGEILSLLHGWSLLYADTIRADSTLAPSQWETSLQSNAVSHWLSANLETVLTMFMLFVESLHNHWAVIAYLC